MKSVVNAKNEFRKVLIGTGVVLAILVGILVLVKGVGVVSTVANRPKPQGPLAYKVLPLDRTVLGKFVVAQGFSASPDDILGEGEESIYRWGGREKTERFLEISFKEGVIKYESLLDPKMVGVSRVAEIKYAERLAWDFLQKADFWSEKLDIESETKLFYREGEGQENAVTRFENANLFRVYFRATAGKGSNRHLVLAPDFETFLARVDVFGPTGQILNARLYPLFLGEGNNLSNLDTSKQLTNTRRPEEGFLQEGSVVYIPVKGNYMRLWQAQEAGITQEFKVFD